jgi:hypothetical protein
MIFGANSGNPTQLFKLDSTRTITKYASLAPIALGSGGSTNGVTVADPITGNFLSRSVTDPTVLWEFNPDGAGTWTRIDSPVIPARVLGAGELGAASIWPHNVTVWLSANTGFGRFHIYKHGS